MFKRYDLETISLRLELLSKVGLLPPMFPEIKLNMKKKEAQNETKKGFLYGGDDDSDDDDDDEVKGG